MGEEMDVYWESPAGKVQTVSVSVPSALEDF